MPTGLLLTALLCLPQDARDLSPETLPAWRERIRPGADELSFERVRWLPSFAEGIERAVQEKRPLFFWAMNGHPLGCT